MNTRHERRKEKKRTGGRVDAVCKQATSRAELDLAAPMGRVITIGLGNFEDG